MEYRGVEVKNKVDFIIKEWVGVVCNHLAHDTRSVGFCAQGNEKTVSLK